ncbi:MAG: hypothetical protein ACYDGN_17590 [Acidimicrobiales bacterium]
MVYRRFGEVLGLCLLAAAVVIFVGDLILGVVAIHRAILASMSPRRRIGDVVLYAVICLIGPATVIGLSLDLARTGLPTLKRASVAGYLTIGIAFLVTCLMVQYTFL